MREQGDDRGQFAYCLDNFGETKLEIMAPFLKYLCIFLPAWWSEAFYVIFSSESWLLR